MLVKGIFKGQYLVDLVFKQRTTKLLLLDFNGKI